MALTRNGSLLAVATAWEGLYIFDVATGGLVRQADVGKTFDATSDQDAIIVAGKFELKRVDPVSGEVRQRVATADALFRIAVVGTHLVGMTAQGPLQLFDLSTLSARGELAGSLGFEDPAPVSPEHVAASDGSQVCIFDLAARDRERCVASGEASWIVFAVSAAADRVLVPRGTSAALYRLSDGKEVSTIALGSPLSAATFSQDGHRLYVLADRMYVRDGATGEAWRAGSPLSISGDRLTPTPDGNWLLARAGNGVAVFSAATGEPVELGGHATAPSGLEFSTDDTVLTGFAESTIVWRVADGAVLSRGPRSPEHAYRLTPSRMNRAYDEMFREYPSPDRAWTALVSVVLQRKAQGVVVVVDRQGDEVAQIANKTCEPIETAAVSRDGTRLATIERGWIARLYSLPAGDVMSSARLGDGKPWTPWGVAALTADAMLIAPSSETLHVWSPADARQATIPSPIGFHDSRVAIGPAGRVVALSPGDGTILLYDLAVLRMLATVPAPPGASETPPGCDPTRRLVRIREN